MEWSLARFDALVPSFPEGNDDEPAPRSLAIEERYIVCLGIDDASYSINGRSYPSDGSVPISASAHYLVCSEKHAELAKHIAEEPFQYTSIDTFLPAMPLLDANENATTQQHWLDVQREVLAAEFRCDPAKFPTAQAAWRHQAVRTMERTWKRVDHAQNGFWYTHPHAPLCEAFCFSSHANEKAIVACDIRSAYGWAIATQPYPAPSSWQASSSKPAEGQPYIALCRLSKPSPWLSRHHPWQYTHKGRSLAFYWGKDDTVAGWFTHFELESVKGLCQVEVLSVFAPRQSGPHPMAKKVQTWFDKRVATPSMASVWKYKIASAHSWSIQRKVSSVAPERISDEMVARFTARTFTDNHRVMYHKQDSVLGNTTFMHEGSASGVWLPSVWTALLVRTRLFSLMRWAYETQLDAKCAYAHVDAVHWIMPAEHKNLFMEKLKTSGWLGENMGNIKVDTIQEKGAWLRPGSYVLWSEQAGTMATSMGSEVRTVHLSRNFWGRNWQKTFALAGSTTNAWYQRPSVVVAWTNYHQYISQMMVNTLRWKETSWTKTIKQLNKWCKCE